MDEMLKHGDVESINFDFCMLGMATTDNRGEAAPAKKRTRVITNSKHVAAALRICQCNGLHSHVQLTSGRAKKCEEYPQAFAEIIVLALKREIADVEWLETIRGQVVGSITDVTEPMLNLIQATESGSSQGWCPGADEAATPKPLAGLSAVLQANGTTMKNIVVPPHEEEQKL